MLKELTFEEFSRRASAGGRLAVYREYLADRETPVSVLSRAANDESVFLLESVAGGEQRGRWSFLGIDPYAIVVQENGQPDILSTLKARLSERPYTPAPELPPLQGGAIGFLAYDIVKTFEPRVGLTNEPGTPEAAFMLTDTLVIFDNVRQTVLIVEIVDSESLPSLRAVYDAAQTRIAAVYDRLMSAESIAKCVEQGGTRSRASAQDPVAQERDTPASFTPEMTEAEFTEIVAKCKEAIRAGECIQIVPSQKFTLETDASALSLYRALRMVNPSPYNFFMKLGDRTLIGSSPEELVKLEGRIAYTAPIAGTRPRGATADVDAALAAELLADTKERAEHVMLVDLGRNDLGRVSEPGTVKVTSFAAVERYSHVMHLVSHVQGRLEADKDGYDLIRAAFPAGTLTGAPKIRAMQLIASLEKSPRGIYGGAAGYFSNTGDMDFAIVIRTMILKGHTLTMRAGAGIVADSDPAKEYQETVNKSKAVFEAVRFAANL